LTFAALRIKALFSCAPIEVRAVISSYWVSRVRVTRLPVLLAATSLTPAFAQEAPPAAAAPAPTPAPEPTGAVTTDPGGQNVVVTGQRLRGSVEGDVEPIEQLDEAQIRAQGATTIAELVERLSPQTAAARAAAGRSCC
jgi:hypothetical protein